MLTGEEIENWCDTGTAPRHPYAPKKGTNLLLHTSFEKAVDAARKMGLSPALWSCGKLGASHHGWQFERIVVHPDIERPIPMDVFVALRARLVPGGSII